MSYWLRAINPKAKELKEFSCPALSWRPLWAWVYEQNKDTLSFKEYEMGTWNNSGLVIPADKAKEIGLTLGSAIFMGNLKEVMTVVDLIEAHSFVVAAGRKRIEKYKFTSEQVQTFATFCISCGGFEIL